MIVKSSAEKIAPAKSGRSILFMWILLPKPGFVERFLLSIQRGYSYQKASGASGGLAVPHRVAAVSEHEPSEI